MNKVQQGFTLIELMIVVAIVGVLAAIALPAYQDYVIRAKVSEGIAALDAARIGTAEYFQTESSMPDDSSQAGINTTINVGFVQSIIYTPSSQTGATITVSLRSIDDKVDGETIDLVGVGDTRTGIVTWDCNVGSLSPRFAPASCR